MDRRIVKAIVKEPRLWPTALRQANNLVPRGWWHHWPPLPLPDPEYLKFRMSTAYGNSEDMPIEKDVITYLHWCRSQRKPVR